METPESNPNEARLDAATSERLAKLRGLPVDISRLKKLLESQIPRQRRSVSGLALRLLDLRAAAASLLVIGIVTVVVLYAFSRPVLASADRLAHIHGEVLTGAGQDVTPVDSVAAANAVLLTKWSNAPKIPELPKDHVTSCCIHMMGHARMVCLQFKTDSVPITMAVADVLKIKLPDSQVLAAEGITYHVLSQGHINMVMTQRSGRWVCLMGKMDVDRLVRLGNSLRF